MILDICFRDSGPVQYKHVRMFTVYTLPSGDAGGDSIVAEPEIVIHFYDTMYPQMNINLSRILTITTTND